MILLLAALLAQDVDNPQFKYWSSCKPGSWVKVRTEMEQAGQKIESETTQKLVELKDDVAILEVTGKSKIGAQEIPIPAQKQEIKAKEPAGKVRIEKEGDEEIEVAGKKLKCRWYHFVMKPGDKEMKSKAWMSMEIPGGTAKGEIFVVEGSKPMVVTALEWEKK